MAAILIMIFAITFSLVEEQGKSEGFDSCDWPSILT